MLQRFGTMSFQNIELIPLQEEDMYEDEENPTIESFYVKVEKLGQGGFGFVFSGKDRETGRKVAIKIMPR